MKFFQLTLVATLAHSITALPHRYNDQGQRYQPQHQCITQREANQWIERYIGWLDGSGSDLGDARTTGEALITDDFELYSGSVRGLRGQFPLGNAFARDMEDFLENQTRMPQRKIMKTLKVVAGCESIVWFWLQSIGSTEYPARGFGLFEMVRNSGDREGSELQATRLDLEWDTVSWLLDTGGEVKLTNGEVFPQGENGDDGVDAEDGRRN